MQLAFNPSVEEVERKLMKVRARGLVRNLELWDLADDLVKLAEVGGITDAQFQTYIDKLQKEPEI